MKRSLVTCAAIVSLTLTARAEIAFEQKTDRLQINVDGKPFATYVFADDKITRPYFAHVHALSGVQVTRNHPPQPGDLDDHATMHPGIWMAFGDISGNDYWRMRAKVVHDEFMDAPKSSGDKASFSVKNLYHAEDGNRIVCVERVHYRIVKTGAGILLTWDSQFASNRNFYFGDQEEMGLGIRVATPLTVKRGEGEILNADGGRNEKGVWGKPAAWCDYRGRIGGQVAGMMIMAAADNFREPWWHARDYGLLVANPFGVRAFTSGEPSKIEVKTGSTLRLRFGVLVHSAEKFNPQAAYAAYLQQLQSNDAFE